MAKESKLIYECAEGALVDELRLLRHACRVGLEDLEGGRIDDGSHVGS